MSRQKEFEKKNAACICKKQSDLCSKNIICLRVYYEIFYDLIDCIAAKHLL